MERVKANLNIWLPISLAQLVWFSLTAMASASSPTDRLMEFSKTCGVSSGSNPRIFAAADGEHWKEYPSLDKIPQSNTDWLEGAFVLRGDSHATSTSTQIDGSGEDFSDSSRYCFDAHGKLTRIEREFRTAWGWGYSETDLFKSGAISSHKEHYFDTKTAAVIPRPASFDDVHEAMKLKVYKAVKDLPFWKLM